MGVRIISTVALCVGLAALDLHASEPQPKSFQLQYIPRVQTGSSAAIACITTGVARNKLLFGHSSLSIFPLGEVSGKDQGMLKEPTAQSVESYGLWPTTGRDGPRTSQQKSSEKFYLRKNFTHDHFLVFEHNQFYSERSRLCVSMNELELESMQQFLSQNKERVWQLRSNCNDLASEALRHATGIEISPKKCGELFSTPQAVFDSVNNATPELIEKFGAPLSFKYQAGTPEDLQMLKEAEKKLSVRLFKEQNPNTLAETGEATNLPHREKQ